MDIEAILDEAEDKGIYLYVDGEKLKYKAAPGQDFPETLKNALKTYKKEITEYLLEEGRRATAQSGQLPPIVPFPRDSATPVPLAFAQQRLWFLFQYMGPNPVYNIHMALRFRGRLDPDALLRSLQDIVARHEPLRTRFREHDGVAAQVIAPRALNLHIEPVSGGDAVRIYKEEQSYHFDLAADDLCRFRVLDDTADGSHVLIVTMHHAVSDGWSMGIFCRELVSLYSAHKNGGSSALQPLRVQYADFALWQRNWLQGTVLRDYLDYWRQALKDLPPLSTLPLDRPRPAIQSFRGRLESFMLPADLSGGLQALSRDNNVTPFMTLLAALSILLGKYSNQKDIAIGTPVANRTLPETEEMIGFFANTLVMRVQFSEEMSFRQILEQTGKMALGAYNHQDIPFELLVDELNPERTTSHTPLFQVMLVMQNLPLSGRAALDDEVQISPLRAEDDQALAGNTEAGVARFDLLVGVELTPDGIRGHVEYSTDLYDRATIVNFIAHYECLLEALLRSPSTPLSAIDFVGETERHRLLFEWNETAADGVIAQCIHAQFEWQAEAIPDAIALVDDRQQLSYGELNRRANRVAHHLLAEGLGPEARVGIVVERTVDTFVGILGILKAGACYLPLDPEHPSARLGHILKSSGARLVLVSASMTIPGALTPNDEAMSVVVAAQPEIRRVALEQLAADARCELNPGIPLSPSNLAYVMYTSGSTGLPKGVAVHHGGWANLTASQVQLFGIGRDTRLLQFVALGFDVAASDLSMALSAGATLCIGSVAQRKSPEELAACVERQRINFAQIPKPMLEASRPDALESIRTLICGGEALTGDMLMKWSKARTMFNVYGPTETTIAATADRYQQGLPLIGRPLPHVSCYVLDEARRLLPAGVCGELYIGGVQLARGYLGKPGLTAERFVPDPFGGQKGGRLYRSGDLVRYLSDGRLQFVGRSDEQVKIRGFRIETGEIEAVLLRHAALREAVVHALDEGGNRKKLVAYVVAKRSAASEQPPPVGERQGNLALKESLLAYVREQLPEYMVPSVFVLLDALPITANGKVDRKALPAPGDEDFSSTAYVSPVTDLEEQLCRIWASVLRLERVGTEDNFFAIGGDSILSIQVVSRMKAAGLLAMVRQLFEHQTIKKLARHVRTGAEDKGNAESPASTGSMPLVPIQRWFLGSSPPNPAHFHQSQLLRVPSDISLEFLHAFTSAIHDRHDALRLRFRQKDREWTATFEDVSDSFLNSAVAQIDLSGQTEAARRGELREIGLAIKKSFKLDTGPLFRAILFKGTAAEQNRLLLVVHHLVIDRVSWQVLFRDLAVSFGQWRSGKPIELPPKTASYQHWAKTLVASARSGFFDGERNYWRAQISAPVVTMPPEPAAIAEKAPVAERAASVDMSELETNALLTRCNNAYGTRILELLVSALVFAIARWTGQNKGRIDLEGHGRVDDFANVDISETLGWFTCVYPFGYEVDPVRSSDGKALGALIKVVKEQIRNVPTQGIGYGVLGYLAADAELEKLAHASPTNILFNYLGQLDHRENADSSGFDPVLESTGDDIDGAYRHQYALTINASVINGSLKFLMNYHGTSTGRSRVDGLGKVLKESLKSIIDHCQEMDAARCREYTPSDFPLVKDLKQATLDAWQRSYPELESLYPATGMQQGLIFHSLLEGNEAAYCNQIAMTLHDFQPAAFKMAWSKLVARHAVFRTVFADVSRNEMLQAVLRQIELPWHEEDWQQLAPDEQQSRFAQYRIADQAKGFAFDKGPLLRMGLFRLGGDSYRWLWTHHHCLVDGWCLPIVMSELFKSYQAFKSGKPQPSLPSVIPYEDYLSWLQRQNYEEGMAYWRAELESFKGPQPIGIERISSANAGCTISEVRGVLSPSITGKLSAFAKSLGLTTNTLIQAAWSYLLYRYSGQAEVVFGQTVSGRPADLPGIDTIVGLFINSLPVIVLIDEREKISEWLASLQLRQATRESVSYVPLFEIQRLCGYAGRRLFNSLLVVENYPPGEFFSTAKRGDEEPLNIASVESRAVTDFDLTMTVGLGESLIMRLEYVAEKFSKEAIDLLLRQLRVIFESLVAQECTCVGELEYLTAGERQSQLAEWNATRRDHPATRCVHELFEMHARREPGNVALVYQDGELTYRELNEAANRLAHFLVEQGVGPDTCVGLCLERGVPMVVGLLGILKAGGAYVPLDPSYPAARLSYMLDDSAIELVLTDSRFSSLLPLPEERLYCLDADALQETLARMPVANLARERGELTERNLAYVIYTSGSTGEPKGVMVPHQGVVNYLHHGCTYLHHETTASIVSSTLMFDATVCSLHIPLCAGKTVELLPDDDSLLERLLDYAVDDSDGYLFKLTPAHLEALQHSNILKANARARHVFVIGGEQLGAELLAKWKTLQPQSTFINEYGPTEATVGCSVYEAGLRCEPRTNVPIGRPIANAELYVFGEGMNLRPTGAPGELFIGGPGLARGYRGKAGVTASCFVPHPFATEPGSRLYRTGDVVRWLPDGNLEFLGRADDQVKINGKRIELGEIEHHLLKLEQVKQAVVLVADGAGANTGLVAYLVPTERQTGDGGTGASNRAARNDSQMDLDIQQVKQALRAQLPDYMVPEMYCVLEELPLTRNGKLDKTALRALVKPDLGNSGYAEPTNLIEELLTRLWEKILRIERVGIQDNFFALGGHSILAMRLISGLREELSIELPMRALFDNPTIQGLGKRIGELHADGSFVLPPIQPVDRSQGVPLSYSQQRLWFIDRLGEGSVQYNNLCSVLIEGEYRHSAFTQAMTDLIDRHEVLRTNFIDDAGVVRQVIKKDYVLPLTFRDLSALSGAEKAAEAEKLVQEELKKPFRLDVDLLLRVCVVKLADEVYLALYTMHHIANDGWSQKVMRRDIAALYEAHKSGRTSPLAPLKIQYGDYAAWQYNWLQGQYLDAQLAYWRSQLAGLPPVHALPLDKPRQAKPGHEAKVCRMVLDRAATAAIRQQCDVNAVTLYIYLHTVFAVLLSRYSNQRVIVTGMTVAGRTHADVEDLIGFFINTLVLRVDLSESPTFSTLLKRNKQVVLDAYAHQHVPFEMIVEAIQPDRNLSYNPLFQIIFEVHRKEPKTEDAVAGKVRNDPFLEELQKKMLVAATVRADLEVHVSERDDVLVVDWIYSEALFEHATIERMAANYGVLLNAIVTAAGSEGEVQVPVEDIAAMTDEERRFITEHSAGPRIARSHAVCAHELFEAHALESSRAVAATCGDRQITYEELDRLSNRVAHYLAVQGVGPEARVAICMERSIEMLVGLLGILKAGGCYVPLDSSYPESWLERIAADCECRLILCDENMVEELPFLSNYKMLSLDSKLAQSLLSGHSHESISAEQVGLSPGNLAYVIYTSGSTGEAKGVMVTHESLVDYLQFSANYLGAGSTGAIVSSSLAFDATVSSLFTPLCLGKTVELLPVNDGEWSALAERIMRDTRHGMFKITPSYLGTLLANETEPNASAQHVFVIGGEALKYQALSPCMSLLPNSRFINEYGPTEATVGCSVYEAVCTKSEGEVSIGGPVPNAELYVVGENMSWQPIGVPGELLIAGDGLARGYLARPALTAARFIPNPFSRVPGERLYRSGDLARWLPNGTLEYLGRIDEQVKIRGFRVEPGDIEAALLKMGEVKDAVVLALDDMKNDKKLVAYVVPRSPLHETDESDAVERAGETNIRVLRRSDDFIKKMKSGLKNALPAYMVPSAYVLLEQFPLTVNEKVDKIALRMMGNKDVVAVEYVSPENDIQKQLCAIWREILQIEKPGIHDNFFDLGGHSLLAVSLIGSIRKSFDVELPLRLIFEKPSIAELAEVLAMAAVDKRFESNKMELIESGGEIEEGLL